MVALTPLMPAEPRVELRRCHNVVTLFEQGLLQDDFESAPDDLGDGQGALARQHKHTLLAHWWLKTRHAVNVRTSSPKQC